MVVAHIPCGIGNIVHNKGAVGISFKIFDTSVVFVGAHLPAHQNKVMERNNAYNRIDSLLSLALMKQNTSAHPLNMNHSTPGNASHPNPNGPADGMEMKADQAILCSNFDYVFYMGDFNYRVNLDVDVFMQMLAVVKSTQARLLNTGTGTGTTINTDTISTTNTSPSSKSKITTVAADSISTLIHINRRNINSDTGQAQLSMEETDDAHRVDAMTISAEDEAFFKRFEKAVHIENNNENSNNDNDNSVVTKVAPKRVSVWQ